MPTPLPFVRITTSGTRARVEVDGHALPTTRYQVQRVRPGVLDRVTVSFWARVEMGGEPTPSPATLLDQLLAANAEASR